MTRCLPTRLESSVTHYEKLKSYKEYVPYFYCINLKEPNVKFVTDFMAGINSTSYLCVSGF
jgi:hypothetical protein